MTMMKFGVGQPVRRVEDDRLVRGAGRYTSDLAPEGSLFAQFIRSPHAHARFKVGDREAAAATPGVKAIYLASDFSNLGDLPCLAPVKNSDGRQTPLKPYPVMAGDEAHHVGDIVAMVVADFSLRRQRRRRGARDRLGVASRGRRYGRGASTGRGSGLCRRPWQRRLRRAYRRQGENRCRSSRRPRMR